MRAVVVRQHGGPEALELTELPLPVPGPGEVRVAIQAIGVNRRDAFFRAGIYARELPLTPGVEAAGVIDELGPEVTEWSIGDRVVYYVPDRLGAYAQYQAVPAHRIVHIPDALSFADAAAVFDNGLTAHYLVRTTFKVCSGHRILVHAAAGGVGALVVQLAKRNGATVFGTVSSPDKAQLIKRLGATEAILYRDADFVSEITRLTDGAGVDVVYDSVGKDTVRGSIRCLRNRGMLVLYGQSSGAVKSINPAELADQGSLFFTRPHLLDHIRTPEEFRARSDELFAWCLAGEIKPNLDRTYPLGDVVEAHRRIEDRSRSGKIVLLP